MKIGFFSGDVVEVANDRKGVSVPDYPVQGYLMKQWIARGHEVVLLTRCPKVDDPPEGVVYDPGGDPNAHNLDVLFGDRLGTFGNEWDETINQIERYHGAIVFHQYIAHSGWAPPFREMTHLGGSQRRWTIINRARDVQGAYHAMAGHKEALRDGVGAVRWRRWEPWLMRDYPWNGNVTTPDLVAYRQYWQGYYGRVPTRDRRAASVVKWMSAGDWSRIVYGPETSARYVSKMTGCANGGRILHRDLPQALTTFNVIVQAPIDRLTGKGNLGYWPHRIVECALSGVLQLFDRGIGLPEFNEWSVTATPELVAWMSEARDSMAFLQEHVRRQQEIILPRADPERCLNDLDRILEEAAS